MKPKNRGRMIQWRRNKILELSSQGHNQTEIADILKISESTVSRDLSYLKNQAKSNIKIHIDEKLPNTEDKREKIQALSLAKESYVMKLKLRDSAIVVDDAIKFVSEHDKFKHKSSNIQGAMEHMTFSKDELTSSS